MKKFNPGWITWVETKSVLSFKRVVQPHNTKFISIFYSLGTLIILKQKSHGTKILCGHVNGRFLDFGVKLKTLF